MRNPKLLPFTDLRDRGVLLGRRQIDRLEAEGKFPKRVPIAPTAWVGSPARLKIGSMQPLHGARMRARPRLSTRPSTAWSRHPPRSANRRRANSKQQIGQS